MNIVVTVIETGSYVKVLYPIIRWI